METSNRRYRIAAVTLCLAGLALPEMGYTQAQNSASSQKPAGVAPTSAAPTESQRQARTILMQMAQYLGKAQRFSVNVRGGYDAVQQSGEKIEFGESRKVVLSRPENRLRIEGERSDGTKVLTVFNGKEITLTDSATNVYATAPQSGSLDDTVIHFVRDLGVRLPLAALLLSRLPAEFEQRVASIDYVEKTRMFGAPAHHLAARTDTVDFQVWVADGDKPVPLRVVLTYRDAPGQPQFRAQLSDWNFAPAIGKDTFVAAVPKGTRKVAFVGQLARQSAVAREEKPADKSKGAK
jgi:hypothetical protein